MGHPIPTRTGHLPLNLSVDVLNTTQRERLLVTTGGEKGHSSDNCLLPTPIYSIKYYIYKLAVKQGVNIDISPVIKVITVVLFC